MSKKPLDLMRRFLALTVLAVSLAIIATYLLSMGLGILVIFSTPEGLEFSRETVLFNPLLYIDIGLSTNAGIYFVFLWWVFALCFWAALKSREAIGGRLREVVLGTAEGSLLKNNLLAMPVMTSMLLAAVLMLHLLQSLGGLPTGEPIQSEPFLDFLKFSRAPVVEELLFRVVPMGAFFVAYIPLAGRKVTQTLPGSQRAKLALLSILHPDRAKSGVGLKTIDKHGLLGGMVRAEWVMVILTALAFGAAHYTGGSTGWQMGKVSQAALSGLVFAVAYLYYGIQAPILLHWFFNYYFTVFDLTNVYLATTDLGTLVWLANLSFGIFLWLAALMFGGRALYRNLRRRGAVILPP